MVSYGNKYPRHNARPHVVEQSGQCARALREDPNVAGDDEELLWFVVLRFLGIALGRWWAAAGLQLD